MKKILFSSLFILFTFIALQAQIPSNPLGLNPASLKWQQIKTDKVQVIFPQGLENQGQRVANIVHYLWDNSNESVGNQMHPVTILLHNQTTVPNGFVTVGPFRSEFYVTPPQSLFNGSSDWLDMLAIHEYRHVKQFANANKGITRLAKTLLGSWAWGGFAGTALPRWYFEGDAVGSETALSKAGRGRMPAFDMEYRALRLTKQDYNYEKASAGSLKDFVPNHYNLGYYMTTYARRKYGKEIWTGVLEDAVKYKGLFHPFSHSLKKRTGLRTRDLYKATMKELDSIWQADQQKLVLTDSRLVNQKKKRKFTSYNYAQYLKDGSVVVVKSGFDQIRTVYQLDKQGHEKRIISPGINTSTNNTLSVADQTLCWTELGYHPRWENKNYSVIKTYNLLTGEKKKITSETRYFSPALSSNTSKIVAVEATDDLKYRLVILNTYTGKVMKELTNSENYFYAFPRWIDDRKLVAVAQKGEENWLQIVDTETGTVQNITSPASYQISYPFPHGEYVYFSGTQTGINNIFAVKIETREVFQVTSSLLGAFQPAVSPDGKTLLMSEFTHLGYDLKEIDLKPEEWKLYEEKNTSSIRYYEPLAIQEGGSIIEKIPAEQFKVKKYNKWSGFINPHSIVMDINPPLYGGELLMDNKFSTFSASIGAFYNANETNMTYNGRFIYGALYPLIQGRFSRGERSRRYGTLIRDENSIGLGLYTQEWVENKYTAGIDIPVNFTQGNFFNQMNLTASYQAIDLQVNPVNFSENVIVDSLGFKPLQEEMMHALNLRFRTSSFRRTALQHINPRWGFLLDIWSRNTLNNEVNSGSVLTGRLNVFFPGFSRNHSFYMTTAYQKEGLRDTYKFSNIFPYSRGYGSWIEDEAYKIGFNYSFPLLYPDLPLGGLLFIKRIKANLFYDFTQLDVEIFSNVSRQMNSVGAEITFDIRALRLLEMELGGRYSYLLNADDFGVSAHQFNFLLLRIGI